MSAFICPVCRDIKEGPGHCNYCDKDYIPLSNFLDENNKKINAKIQNILQIIDQIKVAEHATK